MLSSRNGIAKRALHQFLEDEKRESKVHFRNRLYLFP